MMFVKLILGALLTTLPLSVHAQYSQHHTKPRPTPKPSPVSLPPLALKTVQDEPFASNPPINAKDSIIWRPDTLLYPAAALRNGAEGYLIMRLLVGADGRVQDLAFVRLDPITYDAKQNRLVVSGKGAGPAQLEQIGVKALVETMTAYWRQTRFIPRDTARFIEVANTFYLL
jgi:hypothetical protein